MKTTAWSLECPRNRFHSNWTPRTLMQQVYHRRGSYTLAHMPQMRTEALFHTATEVKVNARAEGIRRAC